MNVFIVLGVTICLTAADTSHDADCPTPNAVKPLASGIDRGNFDTSVRPQDDLFRAVNGGWLAKTEIPADRSDYGAFGVLADQAEKDVRAIVEACAGAKDSSPGSEEQKIGDLYASFMDEARAERLGVEPLAERLKEIDAIESTAELAPMFAKLTRVGGGGPFACYVANDAKRADRYIIHLSQGGIGLPDRDYYWDARHQQKLAAYRKHVERMLTLAEVRDAQTAAGNIVAFETRLAKSQWPKEENRDADKTYNKTARDELAKLAPSIDWKGYFDGIGAKSAEEFVVRQPSFFAALSNLVDSAPLTTWKQWLKWNVIHHRASLLNKALVDEDFAFYGTTLRGVPTNRPRWKRAVAAVDGCLGEAVGKLYVERHFPPAAKTRMDAMVKNVIAAYRQAIEKNDWMGAETKKKALAKLATFNPKIGYPAKWRDYSALTIRRDDLVGNIERAAIFNWNRNLAKLGKPIDRDEWFMTPQTVNAYYNARMNEIVFPAAILQPPFFNLAADDAVNYGGIGAVIGHEAGHGFDDQGSKSDAHGNLVNWWTAADRAEFDKRSEVLVAQYGRFEPFPGFRVNGKFTLGENIGDLAGVTIAYRAYRMSLCGKESTVIDGLTGEQRFFMGWAQVWQRKHREDDLKTRLIIDPHSPAEYRANGTVRNVPEFHKAFAVKEGDKMYLPPADRVKIW